MLNRVAGMALALVLLGLAGWWLSPGLPPPARFAPALPAAPPAIAPGVAAAGTLPLAAGAADLPGSATPALLTYVTPPEAAALTAALPAPSREIHYARIDPAVLRGKRSPFWRPAGEGRVLFPLPDGRVLAIVISGSELTGPDAFTATGNIEGRPLSRVVFGGAGRFLHASIEDPQLGAIALRVATEELSQVYRVDPALLAPCGGPRPAAAVPVRAAGTGGGVEVTLQPVFATGAENPQHPVLDVLMAHTTAVLPTLTGAARRQALESAFLAAIAKVNAAFQASLVTTRVRLAGVHETNYDENASEGNRVQDDALTALFERADGRMDDVHAARDAAGADIVCLALQRGDVVSSGLSFLLDDPSRFDNADFALSIVQYGNIAATNVVAHEIGHVLGCAHDRQNAVSGAGAYPYSYGYRFFGADGRQYHDIMAYPPGVELGYFSNPNVTAPPPAGAPLGIPAGRPGESDTARTIEQTAFITAGYRLQTHAPASPGTLINVATRAFVGRDEQVLIGGFIVSGAQPRRLLVRGAGPGLRPFGVTDALADPMLRVFGGAAVLAENDNWSGAEASAAMAQAGAFPFTAGAADAAVVVTLAPGAYTAVLEGKANQPPGAGMVEVYDLTAGGEDRIVNLATRGFAGIDGQEMVGGFVVRGNPGETKRILLRVLGPSLARPPFLLTGVLEDPMFRLFNGAGDLLLENDDWSSDAEGGPGLDNDFRPVVRTYHERAIFATGHAPSNRREPGVLADLPPGAYTIVVRPFEFRSNNVLLDQPPLPGVGVVEVYEISR